MGEGGSSDIQGICLEALPPALETEIGRMIRHRFRVGKPTSHEIALSEKDGDLQAANLAARPLIASA